MADFDYLRPHLPPLRLIRMDYRGRGASHWTGAATYTVPQEAKDALDLLDHLGVEQAAAILGTSRGGLIGMLLAALAATPPDRPVPQRCRARDSPPRPDPHFRLCRPQPGRTKTHETLAELLPRSPGFAGVPMSRWLDEARCTTSRPPSGLRSPMIPRLREAFLAAFDGPPVDLWPLFDALHGPAARPDPGRELRPPHIRNHGRDARRRPDMIFRRSAGPRPYPFPRRTRKPDPDPRLPGKPRMTDITLIEAAAARLHGHASASPPC
jgi:hypothetical protein